jgi:hypothetical protein
MVAVGQLDAGYIALLVEVEAIVFAAKISAGRDAMIFVEMKLGVTAQ